MKIWLSKNSEVSVREQLVAQITLGIGSQDLKIGDKLPSVREIARRFQIHANTVSAAYRELAEIGYVEMRLGSGVYICENSKSKVDSKLDQLIAKFLKTSQTQGYTLAEIQTRLKQFIQLQPPDHFLVVESHEGLRAIILDEIGAATNWQTIGISLEEFNRSDSFAGSQVVAFFDKTDRIESKQSCIFLKANSVAESLTGQNRPKDEDLIAIISGWEKFLELAKTILVAAKVDPESLIVRSRHQPNWKKGLKDASMIICDTLTAKEFENDGRVRAFKIIAETSIAELQSFVSEK
jgi:DNA-binding transcriptional regulator YhcF (GntR family)